MRPLDVVVANHVAEAVRLLELVTRERDPVADLAGALRRAGAQPALELGHVGGDEERDAAVDVLLHRQSAVDLELEHADPALGVDPVHLRGERAVAAADELDVLEELPRLDPLDELLLGQEPVLAAVRLVRALRARRGRDGDLELRDAVRRAA